MPSLIMRGWWHIQKKVHSLIWSSLWECSRAAWERCISLSQKFPYAEQGHLETFDKVWGQKPCNLFQGG
jgi:hypothetical protein